MPGRPLRRAAVLAAGIAITAVPAASGAPADRAAAGRAAAWLAAEPLAGMPAGQQADVMVAMRVTGTPVSVLGRRARLLAASGPKYATTAGATAKVILGAVAVGARPSRFGDTNYLARLQSHSSGGRYGSTAFDQGLSMIALRAATGRVPRVAATTLLRARSGPGWTLGLTAEGEPDVDSTALSVVALRAAGQSCASPAIRGARAWLAAQRSGGGWTAYAGSPPSANSTALVARSDIACGASASAALQLLRSLQQRSGAIAFTKTQPESRLLATSESVPPLAGYSLARGLRPG